MEIVSGPMGFQRKTSWGFEICLPEDLAAEQDGSKKGFCSLARHLDQPYTDHIDQIEEGVAFYSVWWFCLSLWSSVTSGKLLNVIFLCAV
jgi:hypothetical protein